jgi:glycosyltransferase involved in cell wall biosynthesis
MKKTINSHCPEFGYELISVLPYAYNLFLKGELQETISGIDTSCLYFFSPKHTEVDKQRSWGNMTQLWNIDFPNIKIHNSELDWSKFSPPPLKDHFKEKSIRFEKETIVIFNRYNYEWGKPPINYLNLETLSKLFDMLQDDYQVVYINIKGNPKYYDKGVDALNLGDDELLKKYPKIITMNHLKDEFPELTYNEIQCRVFANCEKYISSNGGQLILSAYFGGENIIFSKKSREHDPEVNSFYRWYHKFGGGIFNHVKEEGKLLKLVREKWVEKKPMINILIRTSNRPNYFKNCINSVYNQTYSNWNIIVGVDDINSKKYVQPEKCLMVEYNRPKPKIKKIENNDEYGLPFVFNLYINELQKYVKKGYCLILDDDDALSKNDSLQRIIDKLENDDQFVMWRVDFNDRLVPSDTNFGGPPVCKDVSSIGFAYHHKYSKEWEPYKRGDFRLAKKLYEEVPNKIFLNEVLTKIQRNVEGGYGRRDDLVIKPNGDSTKHKIITISTFWNCETLIEDNINMIKNQTYKNFVSYFIDDMSTDNSYEVAKKAIGNDNRFILIKNESKKYKTKNFVDAIINNPIIKDNDIIVEIDGDDRLINENVLVNIDNIFKDPNIWICGSKWQDKNGRSMKFGRADADKPRSSEWNFSHLRSFRSFLFRKIKDEDLKYNGEYFKAACDLGYGMPMLEMAGNEHYFYLDQVTYLYNWHDKQSYSNKNSFGDKTLQGKIAKHIYNSKPYSKLQLNNSTPNSSSETKIPESPINNVISNVLQTKTSEKIQQRIENEKNYQILRKSNASQLKTKQTIQFGRFNVPHSKIIKKK